MQIFSRERRALAAAIITALSAALVLSSWTFAALETREKHEYDRKLFDADIVITHRDTSPTSSLFGTGSGTKASMPRMIPDVDRVTSFLGRFTQVKSIFPIAAARARLLEDQPERRMIAEIPIFSIIEDSGPHGFAFIEPSEVLMNLLAMRTGHGDILSGSTFLLDGIGTVNTLHIRKVAIMPGTGIPTAGDSLPLNFAVIDNDSFSKVTGLWQSPYIMQTGSKTGQPLPQTGLTIPLGMGKPLDLPSLFSILNTPVLESRVYRSSLPATHLFVYLTDKLPSQSQALSTQLLRFFETEKLPLMSRTVTENRGYGMPWEILPLLLSEMPVAVWIILMLIVFVAVFGNIAFKPSLDPAVGKTGIVFRRILFTQGFSCALGFAIWCLVTTLFCLAGKPLLSPLFALAGVSLPDPALLGLEIMPGIIILFVFYTLLMIIAPSVFPVLNTITGKKQ